MTKYTADFNVMITVEFEDDGNNDVIDQAYEAADDALFSLGSDIRQGLEMVGKPAVKEVKQ